jgi:quinone-modifying oxidoreductase subunit QmoC
MVETAGMTTPETAMDRARAGPGTDSAITGPVLLIEPDLEFIQTLIKQGGKTFKKCMQCGTCSATCAISPDPRPFPRKEMAWASWGLKSRLLQDPDVWLCFQCNDCSINCPRGARPGDVLAAVRRESVRHYAVPSFLGKWVCEPRYFLLLLLIPAVLLGLAIYSRHAIANALGLAPSTGARIVYSYSSFLPHWLLNGFFLFFSGLAFLAAVVGITRFWRALKTAGERDGSGAPVKGLLPSIGSTLKRIIRHEYFASCTANHWRYLSHMSVFFGFLALSLVTLWVITSGINPLIRGSFVYPFGFWNPWKILANIGGLALVGGCLLMIYDRLRDIEQIGAGTFFDWTFLLILLVVAITGFFTELLHYFRMEPHRHIIYFVHLTLVFALLMYLPFSKFSHLLYRTTAMVYAEHTGRRIARTNVENSHESQ